MVMPDASAERFKAAILNAVERGVKVSLLIDGFGSSAAPDDYFRRLSERGVRFCRFIPSYGRRYLLRNHQKLALADAESDPKSLSADSMSPTIISGRRKGCVARHRPAG